MGIGTADDTALWKLCAFTKREIYSYVCLYLCGFSVYLLSVTKGDR